MVKGLILLKKLLTLFFIYLIKFFFGLAKIFYRFGGKLILLKVYYLYSYFKNEFKKGLLPLKNKLYYYVGNRHIIHLIMVILAIFVVSSNIKAFENRNIDLVLIEKKSLIPKLIAKSPEEEAATAADLVEEEVMIENVGKKRVSRYIDTEGIAKATPQITDKTKEAEDWKKISLNEEALLKPDIITTSQPEEFYQYARTSIENYIIKSGDTVSSIAEKFGVSVDTILWENNLTAHSPIKPGQKLTILPISGITYKVKKGDTINKIASSFKVDPDKILAYNNINDIGGLKMGETLIIPDAKKVITQPKTSSPLGAIKKYYEAPAPRVASGFNWPTACRRITQYFSWRHHAIDIACGMNVPIYAVDNGIVEAAGWATGYGKRIIIAHPNGLRTLYGHFNQLNVSAGQRVSQGQVIGLMGSTGHSTGPHVHFEVMIGYAKQNPLKYY